MGTVRAAAHERLLRQISPSFRCESASSESFDMNRLGEMLMEMKEKMDASAQSMKGDLECKMDANAQRMDGNVQALRGDMQTQRGEMQCMGLNLQAGIKGIMAAPRGGATEPTRGSANCVRSAMETGEVGTTSDVTIIGETETCRVRHEGTTEKPKEMTETEKLAEMKSQEETEIINEVTETEKSVEEKRREIDEHTHVE